VSTGQATVDSLKVTNNVGFYNTNPVGQQNNPGTPGDAAGTTSTCATGNPCAKPSDVNAVRDSLKTLEDRLTNYGLLK
jgi:hypothetical protein